MPLRIATWNVNSVRIRLELLARLNETARPDILCLQETKVVDDLFPHTELASLGYVHRHVAGMKSYNGVAILSRRPFADAGGRDWCDKADCRHIHVTLENGVELHNFYVPAGGDVPDPEANDKFAHKLRFLTDVTAWFKGRARSGPPAILVGDLNVAPLETDVWSHKQLLNVVSHTPVEVDHLDRLQASRGWIDAVRHFIPPENRLYSWWSYRARDWSASDRGRRLDHIWVTPDLRETLAGAQVLRDVRGWDQPSDHAPVVCDLTLD